MKSVQDLLKEVEFTSIHNSNEKRVLDQLPQVLSESPFSKYHPNKIDLEDIYALALNKLPPRYAQQDNLVLDDVVTDAMIVDAIRMAIHRVSSNPIVIDEEDVLRMDEDEDEVIEKDK